jgi:hypothetical protein
MADSSARIIISAVDQTASAFKSAQAGLAELQRRAAGIGTTFGALAPQIAAALSVAGVATFVRSTVNAIDALNDASDATGATVEQLSALEDVARRNGGTLDDVSGILVKFNQVLKEADGKNGVSVALKAIGVEASELRRLDPAEALQRTAVALAGFADDGNKARIVQELFGKSIRQAAPFLKDLAEAGQLNASVTAEQAAAAEQFNKRLAELQTSASSLGRTLVGGVLPALNEMADRLRGVNTAASDTGGLTSALLVPLETIAVLGVNVAYVFKQIGIEIGGIAAQAAALLRGDFSGFRAIGEELKADAQAARLAVDERTRQLLGLANAQKQIAAAQSAAALAAGSLPKLPDVAKLMGKQPPKTQLEAFSLRTSPLGGSAADDKEYIKRLDEFGASAGKMAELKNLPFLRDLERLIELLGATPSTKLEQTRSDMLLLTEAFQDGLLSVEQYTEAVQTRLGNLPQTVGPALEEVSEFAKQFERNIQDSLGETIKRTLAGDFNSITRLWGDMLLEMASQAIAADLGAKLFPKGGGGLLSWIGSLFGFAKGGAFANGMQITPFASGGVVSSPSLFGMRGGLGLMGEAGPEAIMPLKRGRDGKLGVASSGGSVTNIYNVSAGVTRNELVTALQVMQQTIEGRMVSMMRRQGVA